MSQRPNDWWREFWLAAGYAAAFFGLFFIDAQFLEYRQISRLAMIGAQGFLLGFFLAAMGWRAAGVIAAWAAALVVFWAIFGWLQELYPRSALIAVSHGFGYCALVLAPSIIAVRVLSDTVSPRPVDLSASLHQVFDRKPKR